MKLPNKKIIIIAVLIILVLLLVEIWVNNTLSVYGSKIRSLENVQKKLEMENQILENQISMQSSLRKIASEAANLNLIKPAELQYLK